MENQNQTNKVKESLPKVQDSERVILNYHPVDAKEYAKAIRWALDRICFRDPNEIREEHKVFLTLLDFLAGELDEEKNGGPEDEN